MLLTEEVLAFIKENESFFKTPLENQDKFQKFYQDKDQIDDIADYSTKLMTVLNETIHKEGGYRAPAIIWWEKGEFEKVLNHPEIQQFIMDNSTHPAITAWNKGHPLPDENIKPMEIMIKGFLKTLDETTSNLYLYEARENELQKISPDKNTASNISKLNTCLATIERQKTILRGMQPPFSIDTPNMLNHIHSEITKTVKSNLMQVKQPEHVKSFAERILNSIAKLFNSEYKSSKTIAIEKQQIAFTSISKVDQKISASSKEMKEKIQEMKAKDYPPALEDISSSKLNP